MESQKLLEIKKDPEKALVFARADKNEGKYEQALAMYEWFYFNALSIKPSLYEIKLSSALVDWMELAEIYPKAKQRLIEIRNEEMIKIMKFKTGNWKFENFHDIRAISKVLKDEETPIEIFKLICEKETDKDKINKCFDVMFDWIINQSEIELCRQYMGDPLKYVKKFIDAFKRHDRSGKDFIKQIEESGKDHIQRLKGLSLEKKDKMIQKWNDPEQKMKFIQEVLEAPKRSYISNMRLFVKALKLTRLNKDIEEVYKVGKGVIPDEEYEEIFK